MVQVIFGPEGVEPLLGVVALENTGFAVAPSSQALKRLPTVPLKGVRAGLRERAAGFFDRK